MNEIEKLQDEYIQGLIKEAISKNNAELIETIEKLKQCDWECYKEHNHNLEAIKDLAIEDVIDLIKQKTNE